MDRQFYHRKPSKRIKNRLELYGIKGCQFALDTELNYSVANRIINGWLIPSDEVKAKIAAYLGCTLEDLWPRLESGTNPAS